jgi:glutathione S-transferase
MYTLYYIPGACSMAVHIVLNELGQEVKLENVSGDTRPADFLKINPRGQVPVLTKEGLIMREGAAILIYLMEKHNSPILPRSGSEHESMLEWLMFCNATLHPAYGKAFFARRSFTGDVQDQVITAAAEQINKLWKDVETRLEQTPYLAGKDCTAPDILLTVIANWTPNIPKTIEFGPKTKELFKKVIERPAYQKALATEGIEYKVLTHA